MPFANRIAGIIDEMRARLAASPGPVGGKDANAYDEAAKEAYLAGTVKDAPKPIGLPVADHSAPSVPAPTGPRHPALAAAPTVAVPRAVSPSPTAVPEANEAGRPRLGGETAAEPMPRIPASVASIADDFFDGLIRRVEGDR